MEKKIISTDKAPAAVGTYSQGVEWNGMILFSGQIGIDPATSVLVDGFEAQLDQVMKNIDGLLESQGITREHILKTSIFLTNLGEFSKVNIAYENFFEAPYPARSCVEVPNLPKGALVEIEVIAARNV
ncbi:MAG: reactive intermediate/imine deaminase [Bacteriovorax sp. MedPE-SWde]|nr:MAG: reactive intermediate/imine deaminase [Bacteriovorax sp. MedPE-SWde]